MHHEMRLHQEPYDMIKKNVKTIEYRLNDEKRRQIKIGDTITFYKRPLEKEYLTVKVIDIKHYKDLLEMYTATFERDFKDTYSSPEEVVKDTPYYTKDEVQKYGCIAIYFERI